VPTSRHCGLPGLSIGGEYDYAGTIAAIRDTAAFRGYLRPVLDAILTATE